MTEDSCDDIQQRVTSIREKEAELKKRREELDALKKKLIEDHLKLGRDRTTIQEEILVLEETIAECNRKTAADGTVCFELPPDIKSLRGNGKRNGVHAVKHPRDRPEGSVIENNGKTCRISSNGPYVRVQQRKQIRTVLHSILDALNEKGTVRAWEIAKDFDLSRDELMVWVKIMENRGMVNLSYTISGDPILKRPTN